MINKLNIVDWMQELGRPRIRSVEKSATVHGGSPAALHADPGIIAGSGQTVPTLSGSHELGGPRCQSRHRRMSVAVSLQEMELFHSGGLDRIRTRPPNR